MAQSCLYWSHFRHSYEGELEDIFRPYSLKLKYCLVEGCLQDLGVTELFHLGEECRRVKPVAMTRSRPTSSSCPLLGRCPRYPLDSELGDLELRIIEFLFGPSAVDHVSHPWNGQRGLCHVRRHDNDSSVLSVFWLLEYLVLPFGTQLRVERENQNLRLGCTGRLFFVCSR